MGIGLFERAVARWHEATPHFHVTSAEQKTVAVGSGGRLASINQKINKYLSFVNKRRQGHLIGISFASHLHLICISFASHLHLI